MYRQKSSEACSPLEASNIGTATGTGGTSDLGAAGLTNVTTKIEFRLYAWGANNGGTFGVDSFNFDGAVSAVPEPTSLILVGMACAPMLLRRRYRLAHVRLHKADNSQRFTISLVDLFLWVVDVFFLLPNFGRQREGRKGVKEPNLR